MVSLSIVVLSGPGGGDAGLVGSCNHLVILQHCGGSVDTGNGECRVVAINGRDGGNHFDRNAVLGRRVWSAAPGLQETHFIHVGVSEYPEPDHVGILDQQIGQFVRG